MAAGRAAVALAGLAPVLAAGLVLALVAAAAWLLGRRAAAPRLRGASARERYCRGRHEEVLRAHRALGADAYWQERDDGVTVLQVRCAEAAQRVLSMGRGAFGKLGEWDAAAAAANAANPNAPVVAAVNNLLQPLYENTFFEMPDGDLWQHRRKAAGAAFAVNAPRVAAFAADAARAVRALPAGGGAVEAQLFSHRLLRRFTQLVACGAAVPLTERQEDDLDAVCAHFERRYREPPTAAASHAVTPADGEALAPALAAARDCVSRMRALDDPAACRGTLVGNLLAAGVGDQELAETLVDTLVAGAESPAGSVAWMLAELGRHPEAQARCAEEAAAAVAAHGGITPAALAAMPFVEAVAKETMRMHTPATVIHRTATAPAEVAGCPVAKGAKVGICIHAVHMNEKLWAEPEEFRPERHLSAPPAKLAFMPFSAGPRGCPGGPLTLCWAKVTIAAVLERFTIAAYEPPPGGPCAVGKWVGWERDGITVRLEEKKRGGGGARRGAAAPAGPDEGR